MCIYTNVNTNAAASVRVSSCSASAILLKTFPDGRRMTFCSVSAGVALVNVHNKDVDFSSRWIVPHTYEVPSTENI